MGATKMKAPKFKRVYGPWSSKVIIYITKLFYCSFEVLIVVILAVLLSTLHL